MAVPGYPETASSRVLVRPRDGVGAASRRRGDPGVRPAEEVSDGLWRVACGEWLVACGLWRVACGERDALSMLTLTQTVAVDRWPLPARVRAEVTRQEALGRAMLGDPLDVVRCQPPPRKLLTDAPDAERDALGVYFTGHTGLVRDAIARTEAGEPGLAAGLFGEAVSAGALSHRDTGFGAGLGGAAAAGCGTSLPPRPPRRARPQRARPTRGSRSTRSGAPPRGRRRRW